MIQEPDAAPMVQGYSHIALPSTDIEKTRSFYVDVLRFQELLRPDLGVPGLWLRVGSLQLHFVEMEEVPSSPRNMMPHCAFYVPFDDFLRTCEALKRAGVEFIAGPRERRDFDTRVWAAFFCDPAGNVLELSSVGPFGEAGGEGTRSTDRSPVAKSA